jgi:hypothetical protein
MADMESASTARHPEIPPRLSRAPPLSNRRVAWLKGITLKRVARLLKTGNPSATLDRLFTSQHVEDLQLIVAAAILIVLLIVAAIFFGSILKVVAWIY